MDITIHIEKDHAWFEIYGQYIYGRNEDEVSEVLEYMKAYYDFIFNK